MSGEGFNRKLSYTSKPDFKKTEQQHQALAQRIDENEIESWEKEYGIKQNLRDRDPPMSDIMSWGKFDPPVKNDFTTNKSAFHEKFKINKMGVEFISEAQDNFREPYSAKKRSKE